MPGLVANDAAPAAVAEVIVELLTRIGVILSASVLGAGITLLCLARVQWRCGLCGRANRTGLLAALLRLCDHGGRFS